MTDSLIRCDWYLLPFAEQMKFKFLVMHANVGKTLTLGGIRPLSMDTYVTVDFTISIPLRNAHPVFRKL